MARAGSKVRELSGETLPTKPALQRAVYQAAFEAEQLASLALLSPATKAERLFGWVVQPSLELGCKTCAVLDRLELRLANTTNTETKGLTTSSLHRNRAAELARN